MKTLITLLYPVFFICSLIFNHSVAYGADDKKKSHDITVNFSAYLYESTCEGMQLDYLVNFGSFTVEELRQGNVQSKKLPIHIICNRHSSEVDKVIVVIRPGSHGFYNEKTLLTSVKGIGIQLISSKHNISISDTIKNESTTELGNDGTYDEMLEFKPVYLGGEEEILGSFVASASIEVRYM